MLNESKKKEEVHEGKEKKDKKHNEEILDKIIQKRKDLDKGTF